MEIVVACRYAIGICIVDFPVAIVVIIIHQHDGTRIEFFFGRDPIRGRRHVLAQLGPADCVLLTSLDGTNDRAALAQRVHEAFETGALSPKPNGSEQEIRRHSVEVVEESLRRLAQHAILVA